MAYRFALICAILAGASPSGAETLVAARTIRSQAIISAADVMVEDASVVGALSSPESAVGLESRVVLYAGRPIRPDQVGPPAIIERNQIVRPIFTRGSLHIAVAGRSLGRAGVGDMLRVMNIGSRTTVSGVVQADGVVAVGN